MNLEEQLKMATSTVAMNPEPTPVVETLVQPEVQLPQPQLANVNELQSTIQPMYQPQVQQSPVNTGDNTGVQVITLGQQVNKTPVSLLRKINIGEKIRFTILPASPLFMKIHTTDALGKIACFSTDNAMGQCCQDLGKPKARYCLPIFIYPVYPNNPNTILPNAEGELKILVLWDEPTYERIASVVNSNPGKQIDFVATGMDPYGRLDIREDLQVSYANQFAAPIKSAVETYNVYRDMVPALVRKNMDSESYKRAMQQQAMTQQGNYNYNN